jgi:hypothetical protein
MARRGKLVTKIVVFTIAWLAYGPAMASSFFGEIPVGYSDNVFQIGANTSSLVININALGARDPSICASCNSSYTDNYTVNLFNQAGGLLESVNETNYLYYSLYSSSHGIGAGPIGLAVPAGAATLEIVSRLYIAGLLGPDGHPLTFGNLFIYTDGSTVAATPIPATLPLLATGLAGLGLLTFFRRRKAGASFAAA